MRFLFLLVLFGCGNSGSNGDGGPGGPIPLATLDDVCDGMQGLTGRALLAKVPMPTKATFTYFAKDAGAPMPSPFTLDVAYMGGAITCTPHSNPPPGSEAPSTPATIHIVVVVGFKTDDGTFAETNQAGSLDGTISFIQLAAGEPFSAIKGTHKPTLTGYQTLTLSVSGSFGATAPAGNVTEGGSNGSVGATSPVGSWK